MAKTCTVCKKIDNEVVRCDRGHFYCDGCSVVYTQDPGVGELVTQCMFCPECQGSRDVVVIVGDKKKAAPKEFICPIRLEVMEFPVVLQDGISYEREEIEK